MTAQTGRTVQDFTSLLIGKAGGAMTAIPIDTLGDVGLDYPAEDVVAWIDTIKGVLVGKPDFSLDFSGPFDTTAHAYLSAVAGVMTAMSFDVQIGIRHAWEANEPQFGVTGVVASNSGVMLTNYKVAGGKISGTLRMIAGSVAAPAWGTAAEAVPS